MFISALSKSAFQTFGAQWVLLHLPATIFNVAAPMPRPALPHHVPPGFMTPRQENYLGISIHVSCSLTMPRHASGGQSTDPGTSSLPDSQAANQSLTPQATLRKMADTSGDTANPQSRRDISPCHGNYARFCCTGG